MTVGLGLPAKPAEQVNYVEKLSEVGVRGIALGDGFPLPPLSDEMIEASERCAMPILFIGWNVPFGQISRVVAAANYGPQLGRLVKAVRIYDLVREAVTNRASPLDLFGQLEAETACRLFVCSNENGSTIFGPSPPAEIHEVFLEAIHEHPGRLPGFLRLAAGADTLLVIPIPTQRPASLLALPDAEVPPFAILQHVATVAALELERMWSTREELRRLGSETLAQLMEGRLIQGTTAALERLGFDDGPLVVRRAGERRQPPAARGPPQYVCRRADPQPASPPRKAFSTRCSATTTRSSIASHALLPNGTHAGASERFHDPTKAPMASQQAKWALGTATAKQPVARHGQRSSLFGPRSPAEAQMTVEQVLGPLIAYDEEHNTELVHSLQVFLQCNRSWKRATERALRPQADADLPDGPGRGAERPQAQQDGRRGGAVARAPRPSDGRLTVSQKEPGGLATVDHVDETVRVRRLAREQVVGDRRDLVGAREARQRQQPMPVRLLLLGDPIEDAVGHRRLDEGRADRVCTYAKRSVVEGKAADQSDHPVLRHRVRGPAPGALDAEVGTDRDKRAASIGEHRRYRVAGGVHDPGQVDCERALPVGDLHLG